MIQADTERLGSSEQSTDQRYTRRAPHMEKYVEIRPTVVQDSPDAHIVFLKVGNQSFSLDHGGCGFYETKKEAEWTMDMLCIALDRMVRDCQVDRPDEAKNDAGRLNQTKSSSEDSNMKSSEGPE